MQATNPLKAKRSLYLDVARVVAIFSISLNHAVNRSYDNYTNQMAEFFSIPFPSTLFKTIITVFSRVGVPLFLMITGALILNKRMDSKEDVKRFYKHNLLSMLITTEIWYVIMYWFLTIPKIGKTLSIGAAIWGMVKTTLFMDQVTMGSMWYMPMILCLYTTIPILIFAKDKIQSSGKILLIPAILVFVNSMVIPMISNLIILLGGKGIFSDLKEPYLFSYFYLYIIAGYYINKGLLSKWKDWLIAILAVGTFLLCCCFQIFAYARPTNYLVAYDFPLMLPCAGFTFELIRRKAHVFAHAEKPISYISRIAFAIYFVHILLMTALTKVLDFGGWHLWAKLLFLEFSSLFGSILLILPLSKIKFLKKYLFLIK